MDANPVKNRNSGLVRSPVDPYIAGNNMTPTERLMQFKLLILCLALSGCAIVPQKQGGGPVSLPTPPTGQLSTADRSAAQVTARAAVQSFVTVVETVEPVAEQICRERAPNLNCDFRIVVDDSPNAGPNAFQTLDEAGRPIIAFTIPLIAAVRNRDELAFIMSHEAAHHIRGHLQRQQQNANVGAVVFGQLAGVLGGSNPDTVQAAQEFGAALGARTYSKDFELEADALGTLIAARAGYDPVLGSDFFARIPDPGNRFLGTHPANAERVAVVRQTAAGLGL
jgi:predicted Zn-dependent protease